MCVERARPQAMRVVMPLRCATRAATRRSARRSYSIGVFGAMKVRTRHALEGGAATVAAHERAGLHRGLSMRWLGVIPPSRRHPPSSRVLCQRLGAARRVSARNSSVARAHMPGGEAPGPAVWRRCVRRCRPVFARLASRGCRAIMPAHKSCPPPSRNHTSHGSNRGAGGASIGTAKHRVCARAGRWHARAQ